MALLVQSSSSKANSELTSLFGLGNEENLVETFKCKLIQTYGCQHNSFTPAIQMAFQVSTTHYINHPNHLTIMTDLLLVRFLVLFFSLESLDGHCCRSDLYGHFHLKPFGLAPP